MIYYIVQTIALQLVFLLIYDLFLRRITFFNWNRLYLLIAMFLSFALPFVKIEAIQKTIPHEYTFQLPAVFVDAAGSSVPLSSEIAASNSLLAWEQLWYLGMLIALSFFVYKLIKVYRLRRKGKVVIVDGMKVILLPDTNMAFSFFKTVYVGSELDRSQLTNILEHERIHLKQGHTLDLLFFELLRIVFWFNPMVYIFQRRMVVLQEYIADSGVAAAKDKLAYYQDLLSQVFQTKTISFINTFFNHSLIKNRIIMLQKSKSKRVNQLRYLLILPIIGAMLLYTACVQETEAQEVTDISRKIAEISQALESNSLSEAEQAQLSELLQKYKMELSDVGSDGNVRHNIHFDSTKNGTIPFMKLDQPPIYPGCENLSTELARKCFIEKVSEFVVTNFDTKRLNDLGIEGKQRFEAHFVIDQEGMVSPKIKVKTEYAALQKAAVEVLQKLPKMTPAVHEGKNVAVQLALPIIFTFD